MRRFCSDAVKLENQELSALQSFDRGGPNIEAAIVKATDTASNRIDPLFQFRRTQMSRIEEDRPFAVRSDLNQLHLLANRRHEGLSIRTALKIHVSNRYSTIVREHQVAQASHPISRYGRKLLRRNRRDSSISFVRVTRIKNTELLPRNVLLNDGRACSRRHIIRKLV